MTELLSAESLIGSDEQPCPFCALEDHDCLYVSSLVRAFWDQYPVSPGHALVVPRRHVTGWFDATEAEQRALVEAADEVRRIIEQKHKPNGYNLGVNVGEAAGQTVPHLHLHVIPRYKGDVPDPRGGVRFVIPGKANYRFGPLIDGAPHADSLIKGSDDPLLPHLVAHLSRSKEVNVAVAFTMTSGVKLLIEHFRDVIARGGTVRVLTGDYLDVTEPEALRRLLDLSPGLQLKVFQSGGTSFHLKGYICREPDGLGTAFVGSSNLSQSALKAGVEWNYRVVTSLDGAGFQQVCGAFERLYGDPRSVAVDADWIAKYEKQRAKVLPAGVPSELGVEPEPVVPVPTPHEVQREALAALRKTRDAGNGAGLVVLATGLGKTWLAVFDTERAQAKRVLFVAHREEILEQAMLTFRTIRPRAALGKYTGTEKVENAEVTFASIQTLGRQTHLNKFAPDHFDYIVVDEFHHASATTYRRLLDHFTPKFLLGLTATPDRTDGADLLALCGENLVFQCDLVEGIRRGLLSPFDYYGVPDEVDYEQIPWRSTRFDEEALTTAVATKARADNAYEQLQRRGGSKTLAFCVSQRHADFMSRYFKTLGKKSASVHAGPTSDPRTRSLEKLQAGELDVLFAVDMFNEGVDLPDVDTVLMLRPTESAVLWLQQFGRGLRWRPGKRLKVIDYIGNHRTFLLKPRTLFQLDGGDAQLAYALKLLDEGKGEQFLPPGCSVTYDLEAKDILRSLLRTSGEGLEAYYRDFREREGVRPLASEVFHGGYDPKSVRKGYGSWFQFVRAMGDLSKDWDAAEVQARSLLTALETTPMTKSFKMVVLLAMLAEGQFPGRVTIQRLAARVRVLAHRSAILRQEFGEALEDDARLIALLEEHPIAAWAGGRGTGGEHFFIYEGGSLATDLSVAPELRHAVSEMVRELAEWRLAVYLRRAGFTGGADRFICKVSHSNGRPILFLPDRNRLAGIPEGLVDVTADGEAYHARFVKIAVNVLEKPGSEGNQLPDLMMKWFGPNAGQTGTAHAVEFTRSGGGLVMAPMKGEVPKTIRLWEAYKRADAGQFFGLDLTGRQDSGIISRGRVILLFVTLDKSNKQQEHSYKDEFTGPSAFQWQSQNRTRQTSPIAGRIKEHRERGIAVHLFVRKTEKVKGKTQPYIYCGPIDFERWEGNQPITVLWQLREPVPRHLSGALSVPTS